MTSFLVSLLAVVGLSFVALNLRPANREPADALVQRTLRVYCASGAAVPLSSVIEKFNQEFDANVEITRTGGSGELAGQIKAEFESQLTRGAEVCVSADEILIADAQSLGIVCEPVPIAFQLPVIAVPISSQFADLNLAQMIESTVFGVASERAAIGRTVRELAEREGMLDQLESSKKLDAENVMTLAQALATKSVEAAVVWDTTVHQINKNSNQGILKSIAPADQENKTRSKIIAAVVANSRSAELSKQFVQYLSESEFSHKAFEDNGFHLYQPNPTFDSVTSIDGNPE